MPNTRSVLLLPVRGCLCNHQRLLRELWPFSNYTSLQSDPIACWANPPPPPPPPCRSSPPLFSLPAFTLA